MVTGAHVSRLRQPGEVRVAHARGTCRADLVVLADGLASGTRHLVTGPRPAPDTPAAPPGAA